MKNKRNLHLYRKRKSPGEENHKPSFPHSILLHPLAEGAEIFMGWKKGTASRRAVVKLMSLTARLLEFKSYLYQVP